jgi:4-aminobutyrate aminotransferase/(S)-3-amino-2-methylpropionate transaminase
VVPAKGLFEKVKAICEANGILFIADEIHSGMGRTVRMFAIEHDDVEPESICLGKSLSAGLPLSVVTGKREIMDCPPLGSLGGTYGRIPVACSVTLAVLDILNN